MAVKELFNALAKAVGFRRVLRFPSAGNVDTLVGIVNFTIVTAVMDDFFDLSRNDEIYQHRWKEPLVKLINNS